MSIRVRPTGWPEREETATATRTAEGRRDLEKHCGRTLFSILSMDRLILRLILRLLLTLSSERSRHLGRVRSRNLSLVWENLSFFLFSIFVFSSLPLFSLSQNLSLSLSFKVYMCICLRARAREKREKRKAKSAKSRPRFFFGL